MLDIISEAVEEPAFWILTGVGYVAFLLFLIGSKAMNDQEFIPTWVKIVTLLCMPLIGLVFSKIYSS